MAANGSSCTTDFCDSWPDGQRIRRAQSDTVPKSGGIDVRPLDDRERDELL